MPELASRGGYAASTEAHSDVLCHNRAVERARGHCEREIGRGATAERLVLDPGGSSIATRIEFAGPFVPSDVPSAAWHWDTSLPHSYLDAIRVCC